MREWSLITFVLNKIQYSWCVYMHKRHGKDRQTQIGGSEQMRAEETRSERESSMKVENTRARAGLQVRGDRRRERERRHEGIKEKRRRESISLKSGYRAG